MRRRQFVASAALLGTTAVAGCLSREANPDTPAPGDAVTDWSFERTKSDPGATTERPPAVTCVPAENRLRITGRTEAGRPCDVLAPTRIERDGVTFEFTVGVYKGGNCGDELTITEYAAAFEFADALPERVVAVENSSPGDDQRRTETTC